ncbi:MAG: NAD(P)/FAD-dependent oxidoreductase [Eubacteriales bacterium]|nr:NAD(P)/FAD-dependent oxidoreductase [Eubacteriales bacterium]
MKTVVIIGAGPAGLTAACQLLEHPEEYRVIVLEESGEIGGISRTVRYHGNRMDIGGHRFFTKEPRVADWWLKRMPLQGHPALDDKLLGREKPLSGGGPDPEQQDTVLLLRDRVSRIYYGGKFYDYPISMKLQTSRNLGLGRTIQAGLGYLWSTVFKKPETSLENFYINRFGRRLYSMFFEAYTEKLWGRHPREISAAWGAQRVKGLSVRALLADMWAKAVGKKSASTETSLIEQFWYPKYGPGQLWELAADEARRNGAQVLLHHSVRRVVIEKGRVCAVVCDTPDGEVTLPGDVFLSTMPVRDLILGITGDEPPQHVRDVAAGLPYRDFITVGLLVRKLDLANQTAYKTLGDIIPDCWIYVQQSDVKMGRIQVFNNWSPYLVEQPQDTVWLGLEYFCTEGDSFWNADDKACIDFAVGELEQMGIVRREGVLDAHRIRVKKAYPAYFDTYERFDDVIEYLNGIENLYPIGRNGQHRYKNMDHSMLTAMVAAELIHSGNPDKTALWQVNTEKEYHERQAAHSADTAKEMSI